ncbi:cysteine dioxygenase [Paenibacillus elgii]|uniref:cysteine dioxygenase n=1 Tax=Paenibacillus elgii TaxID=189691 RepID=UPI0013D1B387|nr:cysteine dioxygenase family protein [Paenibacillus elgii]
MNRIETIERILSALPLHSTSPKQLQAIMRGMDLSLEALSPYIAEPESLPYGRTSLYRTAAAEAVLIHLPPGTETYIHDHGTSVGCARLLEGTLTNRMFRLDGYGYPCLSGEVEIEEGSHYYAPKNQIHQLRNSGPQRAVAFHLYAPAPAGKSYFPYEQVLDYVI